MLRVELLGYAFQADEEKDTRINIPQRIQEYQIMAQ
jgi:hypothetical protein